MDDRGVGSGTRPAFGASVRGLPRDLRHAFRLLLARPGFAAVSIVTLAVGIGASTAVFGLLDALLLRPLPVPHAEQLMVPKLTRTQDGKVLALPVWSYPKYRTFLEAQDVFEEVAGFSDLDGNLAGEGEATRVRGELVTPRTCRSTASVGMASRASRAGGCGIGAVGAAPAATAPAACSSRATASAGGNLPRRSTSWASVSPSTSSITM